MKKLSFFALSFALLGGIVSCSDDSKQEDPAPATKAEMLSGKDWVTSASTITIAGQQVDAYTTGFFEECEKDNILRFNTNNTYVLSEGAVSCTPPTAENGTWAFNADQTKLTETAQDGEVVTADILELTDTTLKLAGTVDFLGTPITITQTFKKK